MRARSLLRRAHGLRGWIVEWRTSSMPATAFAWFPRRGAARRFRERLFQAAPIISPSMFWHEDTTKIDRKIFRTPKPIGEGAQMSERAKSFVWHVKQ